MMNYSSGKPPGLRRPGRLSSRPRDGGDPVAMALSLLGDRRHRGRILHAVEVLVSGDTAERRYFAAAVGRVRGLSGQAALLQAAKNYLGDLARPDGRGRMDARAHIARTVADITGSRPQPVGTDPFAAAEALFRRPA
jgi:hypothetical protein